MVEILGCLEEAQISVWLDGGWGHDAILGEQTRQHDDLDLIADSHQSARLVTALAEHGFAVTEWDSSDAFVLEDSDGHQVGRFPPRHSKVRGPSATGAFAA